MLNQEELLDFDIENQDISEFDPLIYKITSEIEKLLQKNSKIKQSKVIKNDLINSLSVSVNGVPFAADDISQVRMTSITALANWHFNKALGETFTQMAEDPEADEVTKAMLKGLGLITTGIYDKIYREMKINWKGSDEKLHTVGIQTVASALEKSMKKVGSLIEKAEKGELIND